MEYFIIAAIIAIIAFGITYMWLYNKYRNVNERYEVVQNTRTGTLQIDVHTQFLRKRKGLSESSVRGDNATAYGARVKRVQH